ncbi:MAG: phosphoribosyl-AMP cyclohydrolase [Planctomycetes bacterium]|nr:phosphoribosyl-AMP cyclohydrolase [Planctomycetota bacterium]
MYWVKDLKFDANGLVAAVVQDWRTSEVLMLAFMSAESIEKTLETGRMHYWSRSRKKLWLKGETSGHIQSVKSVAVDCDADALLFRVEQVGGACHEGYRSCFFRQVEGDGLKVVGEKVFEPEAVYSTRKG